MGVRQQRKRDVDRIRQLFTADDADFDRLQLIAKLEREWNACSAIWPARTFNIF